MCNASNGSLSGFLCEFESSRCMHIVWVFLVFIWLFLCVIAFFIYYIWKVGDTSISTFEPVVIPFLQQHYVSWTEHRIHWLANKVRNHVPQSNTFGHTWTEGPPPNTTTKNTPGFGNKTWDSNSKHTHKVYFGY